ncbi:MAG: hypothetical protein Q7T55_25475 [Solirubrobacteraceae bacterium]|nr:hypothetical protein [Solirubrobacteraceae bacterium]
MPFSEVDRPTNPQDAYEAIGGDGESPTLVFHSAELDAGDAPETIASRADDPSFGWSDPDGVQAVAQAILEHHTGSEPHQASLEALVMDRGDLWASSPSWTITVGELHRILDRP